MNAQPLLKYRWACRGRLNVEKMRSDTTIEMMKRVVGWLLSLEFHRAAMIKIFPRVPTIEQMQANMPPMMEVVSLNNNSVASSESGLDILSGELVFIKKTFVTSCCLLDRTKTAASWEFLSVQDVTKINK